MNNASKVFLTATVLSLFLSRPAVGGMIFWVDTPLGTDTPKVIRSADSDGSSVSTIYTLGTNQFENLGEDIVADPTTQSLYFTDVVGRKILRSNADGTAVSAIWSTNLSLNMGIPGVIALNTSAQSLYWQDWQGLAPDFVQQGNADGTGTVTNLFDVGNVDIHGLAYSARYDKIYWSDDTRIRRANLDGTGVEDVVTGLSFVHHLAIDDDRNTIYWADPGSDKIQKADMDGLNSGVADVLTGLLNPLGIALDTVNQVVYWTGESIEGDQNGKVFSANLVGEPVINTLVTLQGQPRGIDFWAIPEPSVAGALTALFCMLGFPFGWRRFRRPRRGPH